MTAKQKATVGLAKGTRGHLKGRTASGAADKEAPEGATPTLADAGISHKLSSRAQKLAAIPLPEFDKSIADLRASADKTSHGIIKAAVKLGINERGGQLRRRRCFTWISR